MADNKIRLNQISKPELSGYIAEVGKPGPSGTDGQLQFASGYGDELYQMGAEGLFYDHTGHQLGVGEGFIPQYKLHVSGDIAASGNILFDQTGVVLSKTGVHNHIYIEGVNDNLIITKAGNTGSCFIFDGDKGNYGVGLAENVVPAFELDISGDQGVRALSSLSNSKGQIEHQTSGTNLSLYNLSGSAKVKISPYQDSWIMGGGLTVGKNALTSMSSTYDGLNVVGSNYLSGTVKIENIAYLSSNLVVGTNTTLSGTLDVGGSGMISGGLIAQSPHVPPSTGSHGVSGQIAFDTGYLYLCIDANHWTRVQLQTGDWT